jgi:manganese transport protein
VILSLQLPFAVFPLVMFTSDRTKMGAFVSPGWVKLLAWAVAVLIAALNAWLLYQTFAGSH